MANLKAPRVYALASFATDPGEDLTVFAVLKMWATLGTDGISPVYNDIDNVLVQTLGIFGAESEVYKRVETYLEQFRDK